MKFAEKSPPRRFAVGNVKLEMRDCGTLALDPDEQITLVTKKGAEYDVARKDWGFYATPSLNGRLESFGLRGVLARNTITDRYFVLLVERGHEDAFNEYITRESLEVVAWLDSTAALDCLRAAGAYKLREPRPTLRCPCLGRHLVAAFAYDAPPPGETRFDLGGAAYARAYDRCTLCGHWFSRHALDLRRLYEHAYVVATYGGPAGMRARMERILALPPERSDNAGRITRLMTFAAARVGGRMAGCRLLDVGAGIGVFPAAMKAAGWTVIATEPDPRTAEHLRDAVGIEAHALPLAMLSPELVGRFDAVTFNRVLEHVEDPVEMLTAACLLLAPGGFVYLEVPDAEAAAPHGPEREEFFIEHHHVFSLASLAMIGARAGLAALCVERLREPSGKFTLRAFFELREAETS